MRQKAIATKMKIELHRSDLTSEEQSLVTKGFDEHSDEQTAPRYENESIKWLGTDERGELKAVLTADILWDWIYVKDLWVSTELRGDGVGSELLKRAEEFGKSQNLQGVWLWTQTWQAEGFYRKLGYSEFTRFENFPKGHSRIGFRKVLA